MSYHAGFVTRRTPASWNWNAVFAPPVPSLNDWFSTRIWASIMDFVMLPPARVPSLLITWKTTGTVTCAVAALGRPRAHNAAANSRSRCATWAGVNSFRSCLLPASARAAVC